MNIIIRFFSAILLFGSMTVFAKGPDLTYVVETVLIKPVEKFAVERRYIGTIHGEKFSLLGPGARGTVASIDVEAGQRVKKDQLLISLKSSAEKRSLELARKNVSLLSEEFQRNRSLFHSHDITRSQLEKSQSEMINSESKLEDQKRQVENLEIRAPFDGIVGVPRVALGESVQQNAPVISVMDGNFFVFINIPASRLSEVAVGQAVRMKSDHTTISAVEKSIDPVTRTGFAKAIFPACSSCIVGDSAYVHIKVLEKQNAIMIDRNAVYFKSGKPHVVLITKTNETEGAAKVIEVVLGEEQEGLVEISSGLKAGDEIIVANPKRVPDGAKVKVLQ